MAAAEMLLDRAAQGVLAVSPEGKVIYANHTIAAMLRRERSAVIGSLFLDLMAQAERVKLLIALGAGRESVAHQRVALPRADGTELPVHMTFAPLPHGQASCLVTDLTEQKRRDESAERSSRFLATLAHELRNMLAPMQDSLKMLMQTADDDGRRAIESMQRQAERMLALAEDLRRIHGG